jgi:hypothetical protein
MKESNGFAHRHGQGASLVLRCRIPLRTRAKLGAKYLFLSPLTWSYDRTMCLSDDHGKERIGDACLSSLP